MGAFTELARRAYDGDGEAENELMELCYGSLRRMAAGRMVGLPAHATLQGTMLVHDAFMKVRARERAFVSQRAFYGQIARAMHDVLVDAVRRHGAQKRGGHLQRHELDPERQTTSRSPLERLDLAAALDGLHARDPDAHDAWVLARAGWTHAEIAQALEVTTADVRKLLQRAGEFMRRRLGGADGAG